MKWNKYELAAKADFEERRKRYEAIISICRVEEYLLENIERDSEREYVRDYLLNVLNVLYNQLGEDKELKEALA